MASAPSSSCWEFEVASQFLTEVPERTLRPRRALTWADQRNGRGNCKWSGERTQRSVRAGDRRSSALGYCTSGERDLEIIRARVRDRPVSEGLGHLQT